jgi:hypothetical protein
MQPVSTVDRISGVGPEVYCVAGEPGPATPEKGVEHRRTKRQQVLKRAQLIFGYSGSVIDCLIIDESPFGVLLETPVMTVVPETVKIRFVGGATFDALRRWATGNKIGLEFMGSQIFDDASRQQRRSIDAVLKKQGVNAAVFMLREARFFNNSELQSAAEDAEITLARLESLLV